MAVAAFGIGAGVALGAAGISGIIGAAMGKCVSTPIISVGCGSSTNISLSTTSITEIVNETITQNTTSVEQSGTNILSLDVSLSGVTCKNININQKATISSTLNADITNDVWTRVQNKLIESLDQKISAIDKSTLETLAPQGSQNVKADVSAFVQQCVKDTFNTTNYNTIKQELFNVTTGKITIQNTVCENLNINQELLVTILANAMTYNLVGKLMENQAYRKLFQEGKANLESEGKGLNSIIDSIMSMIKTYAVIIGVIVVAAIIGFVLFAKSGGLKDLKELQDSMW